MRWTESIPSKSGAHTVGSTMEAGRVSRGDGEAIEYRLTECRVARVLHACMRELEPSRSLVVTSRLQRVLETVSSLAGVHYEREAE